MSNTTATKPAARKTTKAAAKPAAVTTPVVDDEVFTALPKRSYTLNRPAEHADFFQSVRDINEGRSGDSRLYKKFPKPSKGVSAAIKRGVYAAIQEGEFEASNRTVNGVLEVFVTVADKA